ncbi:YjcZ family sporulation protein [Bacillus sp. AFS040349]|nr:YjcZ family sporulation protein [Bacillus sp. AFS040349]
MIKKKIREVLVMSFGFSNNFALIVVLFILLIIIGASYL